MSANQPRDSHGRFAAKGSSGLKTRVRGRGGVVIGPPTRKQKRELSKRLQAGIRKMVKSQRRARSAARSVTRQKRHVVRVPKQWSYPNSHSQSARLEKRNVMSAGARRRKAAGPRNFGNRAALRK